MNDPPTIRVKWERAVAHGQPIDRWFASVIEPVETFGFAQIERTPDRWWLLILHPAWTLRDHPNAKTVTIRYRTARTAKKHLEAWVRANWPKLCQEWRMRTDR